MRTRCFAHGYLHAGVILLQKSLLRLQPLASRHARLERRSNDVVEQERAVDEHRESDDLEPLEGFPAETKRNEPDEERAAGVDCAAGGGGDDSGDAEAEEVESTVEDVSVQN